MGACVCVKGTGWDLRGCGIRASFRSLFLCLMCYLDLFLNIPIILCLKYFRNSWTSVFPISHSNLIRLNFDLDSIAFAKSLFRQSKGTLCCLEKVIEFLREQNEKWLSLWPHIIELFYDGNYQDHSSLCPIDSRPKVILALIFEVDWVKIESVDDMYVSVLDNKWSVNPRWGPSCEQSCNLIFLEEITNECPKGL